ncbi:MAG TPA: lipid-A-disaccharide synthase, partial [Rhodospirillaceae bacterium]|nr:lipid-A-disaccharide synthase [Rhodospirillaceae bacterium]
HPVVEYGADKGDGAAFRVRNGISSEETVICALPGSRRGEVKRLAPIFGDALSKLATNGQQFRVFIPTVDTVASTLPGLIGDWPGEPKILTSLDDKYDLMAAANAAIAASGTVAVELALAKVPTVIAYKVTWITAQSIRPLLKVKFANLINIILDKAVVPERLQHFCTAGNLAGDLEELLTKEGREAQLAAVEPALKMLGAGDALPSTRAARAILDILKK